MKIIHNASRKAEDIAFAKVVADNVAALATDPAWQATLAEINARFPNGVMHRN